MADLNDLQQRVGEWGYATFPTATDGTIIDHLSDETEELAESVHTLNFPHIAEEAADVLMLLLHLAHRNGFSLFEMAERKFAVNQCRTWNTVTAAGYVKHDEVQ